jgi:catechol 2,3-dioxygenase-like lactoylglutathione lyase family enzyme
VAGRKSAADRDLRLHRLDHFTMPIRDFNVATKFYSEILGGVVTLGPVWEGPPGRPNAGAHAAVQVFDQDGHMVLYLQPWGQPAPDQLHPHRAFRIKSVELLDALMKRLQNAEVPYVAVAPLAAKPGEPVCLRVYFKDPDGNQLEVSCPEYPFRADLHVGTFNPMMLSYSWQKWRDMVPDGGATRPVGV